MTSTSAEKPLHTVKVSARPTPRPCPRCGERHPRHPMTWDAAWTLDRWTLGPDPAPTSERDGGPAR